MKRLLLLTVLMVMTAALAGCRCCDWLFRGASATPAPAATMVVADPCDPCNPCSTGVPVGGACAPTTSFGPGG